MEPSTSALGSLSNYFSDNVESRLLLSRRTDSILSIAMPGSLTDEVSKSDAAVRDHNATTSEADASGHSEGAPHQELYSYTFFSPGAAPARKALVYTLLYPLLYNAILMWVCLSLFFGSLLDNADISKIKVTVANLDDGIVGAGIVEGIQASLQGPEPHLRWRIEEGASGWTDADSRHLVVDEQTWAVLQGMHYMFDPKVEN